MSFRILTLMLFIVSTPALAAESIPLKAGPVSMIFEPENVFLRSIRVGPFEVLQGINAPVRNQFWGTVAPKVTNLKVEKASRGFVLNFDVTCRERDIDFFWKGRITGDATGKLVFTFDGQACSTFLRNRIGFCVLHGPMAAGKPCRVETVSGDTILGRFPKYISPHQPFKNIRAIAHELSPGFWAKFVGVRP